MKHTLTVSDADMTAKLKEKITLSEVNDLRFMFLSVGDPLAHLLHHRDRGPRARRAHALLPRGHRPRRAERPLLATALHVQRQVGSLCAIDSKQEANWYIQPLQVLEGHFPIVSSLAIKRTIIYSFDLENS